MNTGMHWKIPDTSNMHHEAWNKGKKLPQLVGENNKEWRGDKVGYRALHHWVKRYKGIPLFCEFCGEEQTMSHKKVHWANRSGKYLRDLTDWLSLCAKCHSAYDRGRSTT